MNLLSFAANAVSPVSVPNKAPSMIRESLNRLWQPQNMIENFSRKSGKAWVVGFVATPAASVKQLSKDILQKYETFLGRPVVDFDLELEYSLSGFIVNREYLLQQRETYFLCCNKKMSTSLLDLKIVKSHVNGPDYECLCFVKFLSTLSFSKLFDLFFSFGITSDTVDVANYDNIDFQEFLEIFSDVQIRIEDVFVKKHQF